MPNLRLMDHTFAKKLNQIEMDRHRRFENFVLMDHTLAERLNLREMDHETFRRKEKVMIEN